MTLFDGKDYLTAMEYEKIEAVRDFKLSGIILALKPPIQVRKGMLLLRKANVEVLFQGEESHISEADALKSETIKE